MAEKATIDLNIVTTLKNDVSKLQDQTKGFKFSQVDQKKIENDFKNIESILNKKVQEISKQDLRTLKSLFGEISDTVVNFISKVSNPTKELIKLQKDLQQTAEALSRKEKAISNLNRTKLLTSDKTGKLGLREAEADRIVKQAGIKNTYGRDIRSYTALKNEADRVDDKGQIVNPQAKALLDQIKQTETQYINELDKLQKETESLTQQFENLEKQIQTEVNKISNKDIEKMVGIQDTNLHFNQTLEKGKEQLNQDESRTSNSNRTIDDINKTTTALDKQSSSLGRAFKQFTIYALALRTARRALHEATQTIRQLDRSLTEQAMVTGKTRKETYQLLSSYQALAKSLGATSKDVAEVATQFMRQGKTAEDALKLTEAAVSAAKVAGISATESVNYLTTALNGFRLSADQAMKVSDKFASIAAISATSYEELATALSKVAAQANLAGMSIDYTTAILAKGIETTREAPETIGTALKTIIARMRELTDYGKTLDDSLDINNVESQLAYVGIALRDTNGELRSTEEVLNELGSKWDTLNNNQQAAIAKALAGTRQQSRLIAMMTDYERVLELQEIAAQSAGATAAQMSTYMEGLDASLNKINVAWEGLVSNLVNSDVVIALTDAVGNMLSGFEKASEYLPGQLFIWTTIASLGLSILTNKLRELEVQRESNKAFLEKRKQEIDQNKESKKQAVAVLKQLKQEQKQESKITAEKWQQVYAEAVEKGNSEQAALALEQVNKEYAEQAGIDAEIARLNNEIATAEGDSARLSLQILSNSKGMPSILGSLLQPLSGIIGFMTTIIAKQRIIKQGTKEQTAEDEKNNIVKAKGMSAGVIKAFSGAGIPGVIAGIALVGTLLATLGITGIGAFGLITGGAKSTTDEINESSATMYNLRKEIGAISTAEKTFDELNNKLIKTNEDLQEMSKILDEIGDKLNDEDLGKNKDVGYGRGISAKQYYESFTSDAGRRSALAFIEETENKLLEEERHNQLKIISQDLSLLTKNTKDALVAQDALIANTNAATQGIINDLKLSINETTALRQLTENVVGAMDKEALYRLANDEAALEQFVKKINKLRVGQDSVASILNSSSASFKKQLQAYRLVQQELTGAEKEAFERYYQQMDGLLKLEKGGEEVFDFIDKRGLTYQKINDFKSALEDLSKYGIEVSEELLTETILPELAKTNGDITAVINSVFTNQLKAFTANEEEFLSAYNAVVNSFSTLLSKGILNVGQNIESLKNSVNNIYETATKWNTLKDSEKTDFLTQYADLFGGESGAKLLEAFETGNYNLIEQTLKSNQGLITRLNNEIQEVEQELLVEEARQGEDRNEAHIKYLKEQIKLLKDDQNFFRANLELILDQQKTQLDLYKDYLTQQQEQLEDSLTKQRDAYQKYFDALKEIQEDMDYEETANRLATNAAKLASSTDAHSAALQKDLELQLQELEKEHLQELRERAQEAVINNIDQTIEQLSNQLDEVTSNQEKLYQLMLQDFSANGNNLLNQMIETRATAGDLTALGMEDWISSTLGAAFASIIPNIDYDALQLAGSSAVNYNASLNINQITQNLTDDQKQLISSTMMQLLQQMGYFN